MEIWQQMKEIPSPQETPTVIRGDSNMLVNKLADELILDAEMFHVEVNSILYYREHDQIGIVYQTVYQILYHAQESFVEKVLF